VHEGRRLVSVLIAILAIWMPGGAPSGEDGGGVASKFRLAWSRELGG
jgi:hypothetical protein